ncbi:MAG: hypothetical protein QOE14_2047 [Humisphaera sp.]|nr:hypothetical protein [Humisphaera sp.]
MQTPARKLLFLTLLLSAALGLAVGCDRQESVAFYDAPKDPPQPATTEKSDVMPIADASAAGAKTKLHWDAPKAWKEMPPSQQMRVAQFRANDEPPVDVTVIPLGPESGALLPNINRWERELGIAPSPESKLADVTKATKVGDLDVTRVDLKGAEKRTLAAIVPHAGRVWFFKIMGPSDIVARQQENFDAFIGTLHAAEESHTHGEANAAAAPLAPAPPGEPISKLAKYTTPEGWRVIPDSKPPRMLGLEVGGGEQTAKMLASRFAAGNAGSFPDNITRWRTEIGLPPIEDPRTLPMADAVVGKDGEGIALEMHNPANKKGVVVVIASARGDLWFFKFAGPSEVITAERPKFDAFLKSLEFGGEK